MTRMESKALYLNRIGRSAFQGVSFAISGARYVKSCCRVRVSNTDGAGSGGRVGLAHAALES